MSNTKILVAGDTGSIHTARFVSLLQEIGYDVRVFKSEYHFHQDEHLHNTTIYVSHFSAHPINGNTLRDPASFEITPQSGLLGSAIKIAQRIVNSLYIRGFRYEYLRGFHRYSEPETRSMALAKTIHKWKPDIVFSLKMQDDGYTVSAAKDILGADFGAKWIHFNWGTDIEFFGKHPDYVDEHLPKIRHLLAHCDYLIADCMRDVQQAIDYGFQGGNLGMCLANGGYALNDLSEIRAKADQNRDVILVKGRQGALVGKAFNVLEALHRIPQVASQYKIKIIMADSETRGAANMLSRIDGINYEVLPRLPYQELLALFATSRMAISASDVDGTPSFLTEAMSMGAFPIHSDMSSVREWITDGENGLLFPVDDIAALAACIEKAHKDQQLVESARLINWKIATDRMDRNKIRLHVRELVETVNDKWK